MPGYFPRQSIAWKRNEAAAFRALTLSAVEFGVLTGVVLRLARALALARGPVGSSPFIAGAYLAYVVVGTLVLLAATAAYLANYPTRRWIWRAPYFAAMEVVGEMATSALLLALQRERWGSARADWSDLPAMASSTFVLRLAIVCLFAALLAGVVQVVRTTLLRREQREAVVASTHEGPGQ
jgi:hypothetical protein